MAIGREPGLEQPDQWFDAPTSAMTCMGSDPRTSSGPAVTVTASTGGHMTAPTHRHNIRKALPKGGPSTHATSFHPAAFGDLAFLCLVGRVEQQVWHAEPLRGVA